MTIAVLVPGVFRRPRVENNPAASLLHYVRSVLSYLFISKN